MGAKQNKDLKNSMTDGKTQPVRSIFIHIFEIVKKTTFLVNLWVMVLIFKSCGN